MCVTEALFILLEEGVHLGLDACIQCVHVKSVSDKRWQRSRIQLLVADMQVAHHAAALVEPLYGDRMHARVEAVLVWMCAQVVIDGRAGLNCVAAKVAAVALKELSQLFDHALWQQIFVDGDCLRRRQIQGSKQLTESLSSRARQCSVMAILDVGRDVLEVRDERQGRAAGVLRAEQKAWVLLQTEAEAGKLGSVLWVHGTRDCHRLMSGLVSSRESITVIEKEREASAAMLCW